MTNSINYPNHQIPAYYSGVTINVTSPVMNTAPVHKVYPNCPQEHHHVVNGVCTHPSCQHTLPVENNLINNSNQQIPYDAYNMANSQAESGFIASQNQPYNIDNVKGGNQYQYPTENLSQNNNTNQTVDNIHNVTNTREVYNDRETFTQAQANGLNATSQVAQVPVQSYPPQYYLNNYNYPQYIQTSDNNSIQPALINPVEQKVETEKEEDLTKSKDIITDIDSRINEQKDLEKNGKSKRVVVLTNEYIMSLENYLNNPNSEIRIMAAKEVLTRFDEDKERYNDAALNALLNKMLQDPEKIVRIAALSALSSQLASGNDYTIELLNNIQKDPNANKEDVLQAANILLQMSADTEIKYTAVPPEQVVVEQQAENTEAQK